MSELTDADLVDRLRSAGDARDLRAFEELVHRHQSGVVANCRYLTGSPADAEDLAQEVFVKAYFGLRQFEGRAQFKTWLRRVKTNHCINFRKRRRLVTVDVDDVPAGAADALTVTPQADADIDRADARQRIDGVLRQMNETLRVPLVLRDMDDLSYQEIADELEIGLSAVKMRIKRAREEFRRLFEAASVEDHAA